MLSINEISKYYPQDQIIFKRNILREYLQIKILDIIFNSEFNHKLVFIGGTCLKIVFNTNRFSEDLDFDNYDLSFDEFKSLAGIIKSKLLKEGYESELRVIHKKAFRCYIKIPNVLFNNRLTGHQEEKILIQRDSESQGFNYKKEHYLLNKFDVFTKIFYAPKDILLAQKFWAILNRKVLKGRDLYDTTFLAGLCEPNYDYLTYKADIKDKSALKQKLIARLKTVDLKIVLNDVRPFLISKKDENRILLFKEFIDSF